MTIGIYSGSFDPIHIGHAAIAEYLARSGAVDKVWLMVSRINPLKASTPPSADSHRFNMAGIVADDTPGVEASDFELHLPAPSYTYRTLSELRLRFPDHNFKLIIGGDNWANFPKWKDYEKIIAEFQIIIYPRPGVEIDSQTLPGNVDYLADAPVMAVSSTMLRRYFSEGYIPRWLIPEKVALYIRNNRLYSELIANFAK